MPICNKCSVFEENKDVEGRNAINVLHTARLRHCLHGRGFICNRIGFDAVTPFVYTEPAEFVIKTGSF